MFPATNEIAWIGQMDQVVADEMKHAGMNVDLVWADWGTTASRQSNKGRPDQGGWNLFATGASGPTMQSPLTNIGTNMACNGMNFAGWPCDQKAEALRQAFLDADPAHRQAALDALHAYLAQVQPYTVLGQYRSAGGAAQRRQRLPAIARDRLLESGQEMSGPHGAHAA